MEVQPPAGLLSIEEFKAKAEAGEQPEGCVRKVVKADVKDAGERKLAWVISTGSVDRDADTIDPKGWDAEGWVEAGAPIMWAHNYSIPPYNVPIAQGSKPTLVEGKKLRSVADFGEAGLYPFADLIYEMAKRGRIRAASVGFRPVRWAFNEERGRGMDFFEQELLEWSIVPVPSNREAIQEAKDLGFDMKPMREWAEMVMDAHEPGLWVPKEIALEALKATKTPAVQVPDLSQALDKAVDGVLAIGKRGRVLSSDNETRIRNARGKGDEIVRVLDEVIAQVEAYVDDEDEDDKKANPEPILKLRGEPTFPLSPDDVRGATVAALEYLVGKKVRQLTGRLD